MRESSSDDAIRAEEYLLMPARGTKKAAQTASLAFDRPNASFRLESPAIADSEIALILDILLSALVRSLN